MTIQVDELAVHRTAFQILRVGVCPLCTAEVAVVAGSRTRAILNHARLCQVMHVLAEQKRAESGA